MAELTEGDWVSWGGISFIWTNGEFVAMSVPMGPLSTKPTDGSTPKPAGMLYRCKECTLLRVSRDGDTCEECAIEALNNASRGLAKFYAAQD